MTTNTVRHLCRLACCLRKDGIDQVQSSEQRIALGRRSRNHIRPKQNIDNKKVN